MCNAVRAACRNYRTKDAKIIVMHDADNVLTKVKWICKKKWHCHLLHMCIFYKARKCCRVLWTIASKGMRNVRDYEWV